MDLRWGPLAASHVASDRRDVIVGDAQNLFESLSTAQSTLVFVAHAENRHALFRAVVARKKKELTIRVDGRVHLRLAEEVIRCRQ